MAGSGWIKFEKALLTDLRVLRMARRQSADDTPRGVSLVIGALMQLWSYADVHIREDDTLIATPHEIDELTGIAEFCALVPREWLQVIDADTIKLPNFQIHNGPAAKNRAQTNARVARHRNAPPLPHAKTRNAQPLPDKTRQDNTRQTRVKSAQRRGSRIDEWAPNDIDAEFCSALGLHTKQTYAKFRDYWIAKPGQAGVKLDWPATWRNWCRAEAERGAGGQSKLTNGARDAAAWAELIAIATGYDYRLPGKGESLGAYKTALEHHKAAPSTTPLALRQGLAGLRAKLTGAP